MSEVVKMSADVICDVKTSITDHCVYEHWAALTPGEPPKCIMVGATKLIDVFKLMDGKNNTEWARIFGAGGSVLVRIVAICKTRQRAVAEAIHHSKTYSPLPQCNLHGYTGAATLRRIACSNGEFYDNQQHAAASLGVSQSAVSRHLRGESGHVRGHTMTYTGYE